MTIRTMMNGMIRLRTFRVVRVSISVGANGGLVGVAHLMQLISRAVEVQRPMERLKGTLHPQARGVRSILHAT